MAQTESAISHSRQTSYHWPELLSKTICDLSQLAHAEFELNEAGLKPVIEGQIDRMPILGLLTAILMYALLLFIWGLVLFIHFVVRPVARSFDRGSSDCWRACVSLAHCASPGGGRASVG
jgi:hypothetical protein